MCIRDRCGREIYNVNSSDIAAECLKMFGVSDLAEVVATRKDDLLGNTCPIAVSSARYVLFVVKFLFFSLISVVYSCYFMCYRISVNKDVIEVWVIYYTLGS